jgi:Ca-activated chloride channel family protein
MRVLPWLAWVLFIVALAQPVKTSDATVQAASGRAIAMVVDVSGSMSRTDFIVDSVQSDRLTAVKQVASEFIEKRRGDRLGLVLFGNEAFIASPLSFDTQAIANNLNTAGIGMAGRSTAIGDALGLAIKLLDNDPATSKAIILLSDGTNNAGTTEPENAAELANTFGIRIHTIAMGSEGKTSEFSTAASADLDETTLQNIATIAAGQYYRVRSFKDLQDVYTELATLNTAVGDTPPVLIKIDLRNIVLLILLIVMLILFCLQGSVGDSIRRQPS